MITKKALIVDDSKLAQFVLKNMLLEYKLEVDTAESAEEALGYLSHQKPNVIFMDHTMPGMDGLEALKVIKNNPDTATIPVMMYTSQGDSVYVNQARALGATDILPKQLKPIELRQVLAKLHLVDDQNISKQSTKQQKIRPSVTDKSAADKKVTVNSDIEELSKLLREAEAALEKETLKQFVQQELEKQHRRFTAILQKISHGLSDLTATKTDTNNDLNAERASSRLASLFWPCLLVGVILVFGLLYFQMQQSLSSLKQSYADTSINTADTDQSYHLAAKKLDNDQTDSLLKGLESAINVNNTVPLEQPLLGTPSIQKISAITGPLNAAAFNGEMQIIAHTGRFCLQRNTSGEFMVPATDTPIDQCQIIESTTTIKQMMTTEFSDFINKLNSGDAGFHITVDSHYDNQPLVNYPIIESDTTAGEWNAIAQQNRRVEIIFK